MIKHSPGVLGSLENVKLAWAFLLPSVDPAAGVGVGGRGRREHLPWHLVSKPLVDLVDQKNRSQETMARGIDWVSGCWSS